MFPLLLTVLLAFLTGCLAMPPATDKLLQYKMREINHTWNENLRIYENHVRFTKRKPRFDSEKVERSMAVWAKRQIALVNAKKLSYEQVLALRVVGIVPIPDGPDDSARELPMEREVRAMYSLDCTLLTRLACGGVLALLAVAIVAEGAATASIVSGLMAAAVMECIFLCDMRARIIPWQACIAFGALAAVFCFSIGGMQGLVTSCCIAVGMYLLLSLVNKAMSTLSCSPAIGNGDMRLIPLLCIFSGLTGTFWGFAGASVLMALIAAVTVIFKGGNRKSYVPYAPGLSCWAAIGLLTQIACV